MGFNQSFVLRRFNCDLPPRDSVPSLGDLVRPQKVLALKTWRKPRFHLADVIVELLDDLWFQVSRLNARPANKRGQQIKPKA
jgi:hypothetical protein